MTKKNTKSIIIIDGSGSMSGRPIEAIQAALSVQKTSAHAIYLTSGLDVIEVSDPSTIAKRDLGRPPELHDLSLILDDIQTKEGMKAADLRVLYITDEGDSHNRCDEAHFFSGLEEMSTEAKIVSLQRHPHANRPNPVTRIDYVALALNDLASLSAAINEFMTGKPDTRPAAVIEATQVLSQQLANLQMQKDRTDGAIEYAIEQIAEFKTKLKTYRQDKRSITKEFNTVQKAHDALTGKKPAAKKPAAKKSSLKK